MHELGLKGNYTIPSQLQSVLTDYGLRVHYLDKDMYRIESVDGDLDIDQLCPDSVDHNGEIFDLKNLKRFSEFLHQPINASLAFDLPEIKKPKGFVKRIKQIKEQEASIHEERVPIHRLLRFAVTGSVEIPPDEEEGLDKETAECHAKTEQAIRDTDTWRNEIEFGNKEDKISAIPNTKFDLKKGYRFTVSAENADLPGLYQHTLNEAFWDLVNKVTDGLYEGRPNEIHLSGAELEKLSLEASGDAVKDLIDHVEFEEAVQEKLESIEKRAADPFRMSAIAGDQSDKSQQLKQLMNATSALSPIFNSEFMREAWTRYNYTERHESPLEGLQKEMATFMAVAEMYSKDNTTTPAQMEALATEFYSLLSFSKLSLEALENGLAKQARKDKDNQDIKTLREGFADLKNQFANASIAGVGLNKKFLTEDQQEALKTLEKRAGKPQTFFQSLRSGGNDVKEAGVEAGEDFFGDVFGFLRDDPKIAAAVVGLATYLFYQNGGDPTCTVPFFDPETGQLTEMAIDCEDAPDFKKSSSHWDLKFSVTQGYYLFKHIILENVVAEPSLKFMEFLRNNIHKIYEALDLPQNLDSNFIKSAEGIIQPLGDKLMDVNTFQDASHAAFWIWCGDRGYRQANHRDFHHAAKGFARLFDLASPITDLGYRAGANVSDKVNDRVLAPATSLVNRMGISLPDRLTFEKRTKLSEHLINGLGAHQPMVHYKGDFKPASNKDLMEKLAEAAKERMDLEEQLPKEIRPFEGKARFDQMNVAGKRLDGLTRKFKISAENFKPTLDALDKFDHLMKNISGHVLSNEPWHISKLIASIDSVKAALKEYQKTGNAENLDQVLSENLEYILASEIRYRGDQSPVYEALFGKSPNKKSQKRLMRSAETTIGKEKRANNKTILRAKIRGEGEKPLSLTGHVAARAKIFGNNLWGRIVSNAKTARRVSDRVFSKEGLVLGAGLAVASVGMDMMGVSYDFTDAVSSVTGAVVGSSATMANFLHYNFWEDIVGVHVGTGSALMAGGYIAGLLDKRLIRPAVMTGLETKKGQKIVQAYNWSAKGLKRGIKIASDAIQEKNQKWGDQLTDRLMKSSPAPNLL